MTGWEIVGACILAAPFIAGAVLCLREGGLPMFAFVFGGTALIGGVCFLGSALVNGWTP